VAAEHRGDEVARALKGTYVVFVPMSRFRRVWARWLAEFVPEPANVTLSWPSLAALTRSAKVFSGLSFLTMIASGVYWYMWTLVTSSVLYCTLPSRGWSTMCGRFVPITV